MKRIYLLSLLLVCSGKLLAEGGEYWRKGGIYPWFPTAQAMCDHYHPPSPKEHPLATMTYTFAGLEIDESGYLDCYTEVCTTYKSNKPSSCSTYRYVSGKQYHCPEGTIPDFDARQCYPRYRLMEGPTCPVPLEGDPVNPLTGNLLLHETDISGRDGMAFSRSYQSLGHGQAGANFGLNWTHNFAARVQKTHGEQLELDLITSKASGSYTTPKYACISGWRQIKSRAFNGLLSAYSSKYVDGACVIEGADGIKATLSIIPDRKVTSYIPYRYMEITRPNGKRYQFRKESTNEWSNLNGLQVLLTEDDQHNWTLILENGTTEFYNSDGLIQHATTKEGKQTLYAYNADKQLILVTHPNGQTTNFEYLDDRISQVIAPGGSVSYSYDASGNLTFVTYPDNTKKQYKYENTDFPNLLTAVIDENGNQAASWVYDYRGRVTENERAEGTEHYRFKSNANPKIVTDSSGATRKYYGTIINNKITYTKVIGDRCDDCGHGDDQQLSHDSNGHVISRTDWNGNTTTYIRDDTGLELSRTEAAGTSEARTISTEWHSEFRKPIRITEPERITEYTYSASGLVINKTYRPRP